MSEHKRTKILVVDDEIGIRELMSEVLTDEGYAVAVAENAEAAWRARVDEQPAMILLDIWMPDLDGVTLLRRWADAGLLDIPVVVMSGHATIDTAVEAMKLGAVEVLEKPVAMTRLLRAVEKALSSRFGGGADPFIQQTDFGATQAMRKLKSDLLAAAADNTPTLFVGTPDSAAQFFAQYLCPAKVPPVLINSGAQLDEGIESVAQRAEGGGVVIRMVNWFSPAHQSALLGVGSGGDADRRADCGGERGAVVGDGGARRVSGGAGGGVFAQDDSGSAVVGVSGGHSESGGAGGEALGDRHRLGGPAVDDAGGELFVQPRV